MYFKLWTILCGHPLPHENEILNSPLQIPPKKLKMIQDAPLLPDFVAAWLYYRGPCSQFVADRRGSHGFLLRHVEARVYTILVLWTPLGREGYGCKKCA